jgi:hypothetical protein
MVVVNAQSPSVAIPNPVPPPLPSASHHQRAKDVSADEGRPVAVWIYVDRRKQVGDEGHLEVFANEAEANAWFAEHDPEGVAFEYPPRSALPDPTLIVGSHSRRHQIARRHRMAAIGRFLRALSCLTG